MSKVKFGDIIKGIHASDSNPQRYGYYVETISRNGRVNSGKFYRCTNGNGNFWEYPISATKAQKIVTEKIIPPVPSRNFDWTAWIDGDEETGPWGYGDNEKDAIKDLMELLIE